MVGMVGLSPAEGTACGECRLPREPLVASAAAISLEQRPQRFTEIRWLYGQKVFVTLF